MFKDLRETINNLSNGKKITITILSLAVLFGGTYIAANKAAFLAFVGKTGTVSTSKPDFAKDQILVKFKKGASKERIEDLNTKNGTKIKDTIKGIDVNIISVPAGKSAEVLVEAYKKNDNVQFAELDYIATLEETIPNDPLYNNYPNDPTYNQSVYMAPISLPQAWDVTQGSKDIKVAVIDSGIKFDHPDLAGKILPGYDFAYNDAIPADDLGHGTKVSGTLAAATNNGLGIAGVTWESMILPIKVCNEYGSCPISNIAKGIQYAADQGARIANLSLGLTEDSSTIKSAIDYAFGKNTIAVSAAGNSSSAVKYPAAYEKVLGASGLTRDGLSLASFSCYGPEIDVASPAYVTSTNTGTHLGGYDYLSGTSFASPITAGVIALALSANPSLNFENIKAMIEKNSDDLGDPGFDNYFGWGRINAKKMVDAAKTWDTASKPTVSVTSPVNGANVSGATNITASATDASGIRRVEFYLDGTQIGVSKTAPYSIPLDLTSYSGSHSIVVRAYNGFGNFTDSSTVTVNVSAPLTVAIASPANGATVSGSITVITTTSSNINKVEFYADNVLKTTDTAYSFESILDTKVLTNGSHTLKAIGYDALGNKGESSITVNVSNTTTSTSTPATVSFTGTVGGRGYPTEKIYDISPKSTGTAASNLTWSGKGTLSLTYLDANGAVLKTTSGKTPLSLSQAVTAGAYKVKVAVVSGKATFTLKVTLP